MCDAVAVVTYIFSSIYIANCKFFLSKTLHETITTNTTIINEQQNQKKKTSNKKNSEKEMLFVATITSTTILLRVFYPGRQREICLLLANTILILRHRLTHKTGYNNTIHELCNFV